jgi:hypothetical protein
MAPKKSAEMKIFHNQAPEHWELPQNTREIKQTLMKI